MDRPLADPRSRRRREALIALGSFSAVLAMIGRPQTALAHRSRVALTRLAANDAASTWEFTTTLHLHDAAGALVKLTGDAGADPTSPSGGARLALELERAAKRIGASLQAAPSVFATEEHVAAFKGLDLAEIAITSAARLVAGEGPAEAFRLPDVAGIAVVPGLAEGSRCERCWKVLPEVGQRGKPLCRRCEDAVAG